MKSVEKTYRNDEKYLATFAPVSAAMQSAMISIFTPANTTDPLRPAYFSDVSNLTFSAAIGTGDIAIGSFKQDRATGIMPGPASGGDIWLTLNAKDTGPGTYENYTLLHEIAHAIGLEHGAVYPGGLGPSAPHLNTAFDSTKYTIMSYNYDQNWNGNYAKGLQQFDIAALQQMYGANYSTRADDTIYSFSQAPGILTIWDGGGLDILDASALTTKVKIDLQPGAFSSIGGTDNVAMALVSDLDKTNASRPLIEAAKGGVGDDHLTGNNGANLLWSGAGKNILYGLDGDDVLFSEGTYDTLRGGTGNDILYNDQRDGKTTYIFERGGDRDIIADQGASGIQIRLANLAPADVEMHVRRYKDGDLQFPDGSLVPLYKYSFMYLDVKGTNDSLVLPHWIYRDEWAKKVVPSLSYASDSMVFERTGTVWNMDIELEKNLIVTEVADESALWAGLEIYLIAENNPLII